MSEAINKLISGLNEDLVFEYGASIQYVQHASVMSGAQYESIKKELLVHAQEELQHAVILSEQIDFLGGTPSVDVAPREVSTDNIEMLKQDLKLEDDAIIRYKERILHAEQLQEYGLRRVIEDILIQEEEHKRDLISALQKQP